MNRIKEGRDEAGNKRKRQKKKGCTDLGQMKAPRVMEIKAKVNKWDLHKFKSFSQQRKQQNEMTTHRLEENICKQHNQ